VALALILFFYAANSEVVWLYLLAYWIAALVVASTLYAAWNHPFSLDATLAGIRRASGFDADGLAEDLVKDQPFEFDRLRIKIVIGSPWGTRGPARAYGNVGVTSMSVAAGVVRKSGGHIEQLLLQPSRRGPVEMSDWWLESGDPLGLFKELKRGQDGEVALVLPRFTSLRAQPLVRELEASVTAPRAGYGTEVFGVRPYHPGDPLRRIHWRTTARRGELIVREFEPPGVQNLGIFLDPDPLEQATADQVARIAASEAWDCLRAGGRVTLWAPGCEPSRRDEERNFLALLQWLARYPKRSADAGQPPLVGAAVAVTTKSDRTLLDAIENVRSHGGPVRAWVVGDAELTSDIEVERAGLGWPPR
jgi:uncharacterized protein (DUF58 family)